jgi:membrane fusion protein, protease secretion system
MNNDTSAAVDAEARSDTKEAVKTDARVHSRLGWWLIVVFLGGFLLWAFLAPLDKGVPMGGTVTVAGNKKAVQHLTGGTVDKLLVKEGDTVKAGQVLVRMNSVQAHANAETSRVQFMNALATEARLMAERDGLQNIVFPPETLAAANNDPRVASTLAVQRQLFSSRQGALRSEVAALSENIAGLQAFGKGVEQSREGKLLQLKLLKQQVDGMRDLAKDGYMPRNRLLELERDAARLDASVAEDTGTLGRNQSQMGEMRLRMLQVQQDFQKELRTQLAETQKEVDALRSRLQGLDYEVNNAEVKAPVEGMVADVAVFTEGGVVAPGFRMMDIVPLDEPLVVEGQVPVHLIDSVHPKLPVELIFSAFNQNTTPRISGVVTQVSPDRLVDEKSGEPYYRMRAEVTPEGRKMLANLQVRPGMPVELFVRTGERTLANYLIKPLRDNFRMSLTEE